MIANLYHITNPLPLWQVVYRDALQRDSRGHAKRIKKHFTRREDAVAYQSDLNKRLMAEGTAGMHFDAVLRSDALAARQRLNAAGHLAVSLLQLAEAHNDRARHGGAVAALIAPELAAFLEEKEFLENAPKPTITNLRNRIQRWVDDESIVTLGDFTRERFEALRTRPGVGAHSRRNDVNAVSSFCTWLFDKGRIGHHPLRGLRRPKVPIGKKATLNVEECAQLLSAAQQYLGGKWLGTIAAMLWIGPRPSELTETRFFYGRHPYARIEGGKLRGRANRTVPLMPAAVAWLKAAGSPASVAEINSKARRRICELANVRWVTDIARHTFISNRIALVRDDAAVGREAATSVEMIHRHYHSLKLLAEARKWAALRPG